MEENREPASQRPLKERLTEMSHQLDELSKLPNTQMAQELEAPLNVVNIFRYRKAVIHPRKEQTKTIVSDIDAFLSTNNSCYELTHNKERLFLIVTSDERDQHNLLLQKDEGKFVKLTNNSYGNLDADGFQIRLYQAVEEDAKSTPLERSFRRLAVKISGKNQLVKVRNIPVQMMRSSLGLTAQPPIEGTHYYKAITSNEMESYIDKNDTFVEL